MTKCSRCKEEINMLKPHIKDMHNNMCIGYMHIGCFNKAYQLNKKKVKDEDDS